MYRTTILPMDAVIAVSLVDLSMQDCTLSDTVDALHSTFQRYPDFEYLCTANKLLTRLGLDEIWRNELLYYGKLLQVDHKTLENDIERGNHKHFAKYDDVTDDNIPLSASLVTSSYFNNKKTKTPTEIQDELQERENFNQLNNFEDAKVNKKLAATLKKHATLNKTEKLPSKQKNSNSHKRKRKTVTVDVKIFKNKAKRLKKSKPKNKVNSSSNSSESDGETVDERDVLNAVPSVNDIFLDLGIDFKFKNSNIQKNLNKEIVSNKKSDIELSGSEKMENHVNEKHINNTTLVGLENELDPVKTPNKTIDKLKQFQFTEKHDLSKFYEEKAKVLEPSKSNLVKIKYISKTNSDASTTGGKSSVSSSQLSIFETSNCDIIFEDDSEQILQINKSAMKLENIEKCSVNDIKKEPVSNSQISIFETTDCDIDLDI